MRTHREAGRQAGAPLSQGTYKKWVAALGIAAAAPGLTPGLLAADGPAAETVEQTAEAAAVPANQRTADAVAGALRGSGLRGTGIEIVVREGVCRLTGTVASPAMKRLAGDAAAAVEGVSAVDNAMTVRGPAPVAPAPVVTPAAAEASEGTILPVAAVAEPVSQAGAPAPVSNQAVAQQIAIAVQQAGLAGYDMEIRYQDGTCTLSGTVADAAQVSAADAAARGVDGVGTVANRLVVGQAAAAPARTAPLRTAQLPTATGPAARGPRGQLSREEVARRRAIMQQYAAMSGRIPPQAMRAAAPGMMPPGMVRPASRQVAAPGCPPGANPAAPAAMSAGAVYNQANLPDYAWPGYAQHPNYAAVTYPKDYSASAWPYIGPFYPYPQVPLGWREVELEWDDGQWYLDFNDRTDRWYWFLNPENW